MRVIDPPPQYIHNPRETMAENIRRWIIERREREAVCLCGKQHASKEESCR